MALYSPGKFQAVHKMFVKSITPFYDKEANDIKKDILEPSIYLACIEHGSYMPPKFENITIDSFINKI